MFKTKIFILSSILMLLFVISSAESVKAETGLDFEIPAPETSELQGTHDLRLFGRDVKGLSYKSQENEYRVVKYYNNFFNREGFKKILDQKMPQGNTRRIQFRKENFVADIVVTPTDEGTNVGIAKYTLPDNVSKLEDMPMSIDDSFVALPKSDTEGEDLDIIPRPPQSVRLGSMEAGNEKFLTYTSKLSIEELRQFYKNKMSFGGWQLKNEIDMNQLAANYKKLTGKEGFGLGKIKFPMQGAGDLEQATSQSYVLEFEGYGSESAKVTIMPNVLGKDSDNIVQINYSEESYEPR